MLLRVCCVINSVGLLCSSSGGQQELHATIAQPASRRHESEQAASLLWSQLQLRRSKFAEMLGNVTYHRANLRRKRCKRKKEFRCRMALVQSLAAGGDALAGANAALEAVSATADEDEAFEAHFAAFWLSLQAMQIDSSPNGVATRIATCVFCWLKLSNLLVFTIVNFLICSILVASPIDLVMSVARQGMFAIMTDTRQKVLDCFGLLREQPHVDMQMACDAAIARLNRSDSRRLTSRTGRYCLASMLYMAGMHSIETARATLLAERQITLYDYASRQLASAENAGDVQATLALERLDLLVAATMRRNNLTRKADGRPRAIRRQTYREFRRDLQQGDVDEPIIITDAVGLGLQVDNSTSSNMLSIDLLLKLCGGSSLGQSVVDLTDQNVVADSPGQFSALRRPSAVASVSTLRDFVAQLRDRNDRLSTSKAAVSGWPVSNCPALAQRISQPAFVQPFAIEEPDWQQPVLHINPSGRCREKQKLSL